jgi:hypothetical protein
MQQWKKGAFLGLVAALVLVLASPAWAKERTTWRFDKGFFENTSGNTWTERIGEETRHWTEVRRTDDFIELTREEKGKEHFMRLFDDHASRKATRGSEWERVFTGKWDR